MTYKPDSSSTVEGINIDAVVVKSVATNKDGAQGQFHNAFYQSGGVFHGEWQIPESAPLIFPGIESMGAEKQSYFKKKSAFLSNYLDRRAQAEFVCCPFYFP